MGSAKDVKNEDVYFFGGFGGGEGTVEVYNVRTGQSRYCAKMRRPRCCGCSAVSVLENTVSVFGGCDESGSGNFVRQVETLDTRTNQWIDGLVPDLPVGVESSVVLRV